MLSTCLSAFPSLGCTEGGLQNRENCPLPKAHRVPERTLPGGSLVRGEPLGQFTSGGVGGVEGDVGQVCVILADGQGPLHHGVCSTWLSSLKPQDPVPCFVRRQAPLLLSPLWHHWPRELWFEREGSRPLMKTLESHWASPFYPVAIEHGQVSNRDREDTVEEGPEYSEFQPFFRRPGRGEGVPEQGK